MTTINIASQYTTTPGTRFKNEGDFSGEDFRDTVLIPAYRNNQGDTIIIELDGVEGYPASFLEEAFGGFARLYGKAVAQAALDLRSADQTLIDEIQAYIKGSS